MTQQQLDGRNRTIDKLHEQIEEIDSDRKIHKQIENSYDLIEAKERFTVDSAAALYLDLMKPCLTNWTYEDMEEKPFDPEM